MTEAKVTRGKGVASASVSCWHYMPIKHLQVYALTARDRGQEGNKGSQGFYGGRDTSVSNALMNYELEKCSDMAVLLIKLSWWHLSHSRKDLASYLKNLIQGHQSSEWQSQASSGAQPVSTRSLGSPMLASVHISILARVAVPVHRRCSKHTLKGDSEILHCSYNDRNGFWSYCKK